MHAQSLQSCLTLCDPMDCSQLGSSVHGILQARILEWVAMSFSRGFSPDREVELTSPELAGRFFTTEPPGKATILSSELSTLLSKLLYINGLM